jgi:hypothetical protein
MVTTAQGKLDMAGEALESTRSKHAETYQQAIGPISAIATETALSASATSSPKSPPSALTRSSAARAADASSSQSASACRAARNSVFPFGAVPACAASASARPVGEKLLVKAKRLRQELSCVLGVLAELSHEEFSNDARDRQLDVPTFSSIYKDQTARAERNVPLAALRAALEEFNTLAAQDEVKRAVKQATDVHVRWRAALRNARWHSPARAAIACRRPSRGSSPPSFFLTIAATPIISSIRLRIGPRKPWGRHRLSFGPDGYRKHREGVQRAPTTLLQARKRFNAGIPPPAQQRSRD